MYIRKGKIRLVRIRSKEITVYKEDEIRMI